MDQNLVHMIICYDFFLSFMLTGSEGCIETIVSLHRAGEEKPTERNKRWCFRHSKKYYRVSFMLIGCDSRSFANKPKKKRKEKRTQTNKKKACQIPFFFLNSPRTNHDPFPFTGGAQKGPCIRQKPARHTRNVNIPAQKVPKHAGTDGP